MKEESDGSGFANLNCHVGSRKLAASFANAVLAQGLATRFIVYELCMNVYNNCSSLLRYCRHFAVQACSPRERPSKRAVLQGDPEHLRERLI